MNRDISPLRAAYQLQNKRSTISRLATTAVVAGLLCVSPQAFAQSEDVNIGDLRNQFAEARGENGLTAEEEALLAEEAALLAELEQSGDSLEASTDTPFTSPVKASANMEKLNIQNGEAKRLAAENKQLLDKIAKLEKELKNHSSTIESQLSSLTVLEKKNQKLSKEKKASEKAKSEAQKLRGQLILAETEVDRLSKIIEKYNAHKLGKSTTVAARRSSNSAPSQQRSVMDEARASDMLVATVNVGKANLRTGPGTHNSPLMSVSRGTRLAVETRSGSWLRVIAPTGVRAWVSTDVVAFGPGRQERPSRTVRIKGYQPINGGSGGAVQN